MLPIGEIKKQARQRLEGRWKTAALLNVIPVLIAVFLVGDGFSFEFFTNNPNVETVETGFNAFFDVRDILINLATILFSTGVSYTLLDMVRNSRYTIDPLGDSLQVFKKGYTIQVLAIAVLVYVFTFLWALLFIIPGIIASYAYSQAYYIYKDSEEAGENLSPKDCLDYSKEMMKGNKGRLFLLDLSFIGWHFVGIMTLGIGYLVITPYIETAKAIFYADLVESQTYNHESTF